jgi:hypothetical protein
MQTLREAMYAGKYFDMQNGAFKMVFYPANGRLEPAMVHRSKQCPAAPIKSAAGIFRVLPRGSFQGTAAIRIAGAKQTCAVQAFTSTLIICPASPARRPLGSTTEIKAEPS